MHALERHVRIKGMQPCGAQVHHPHHLNHAMQSVQGLPLIRMVESIFEKKMLRTPMGPCALQVGTT